MKIFGKEPAAWAALIQGAIAVVFATGLVPVSADQATLIQVASAALFAAVTAFLTKSATTAVVVSLAQAVAALLVGFGLKLDPATTAAVIGGIQVVAGFWLRQQTEPAASPGFRDEPLSA